ncbi:MAG TPA: ATP-binding SpoIIE family protein phosphatase [Acidimicrobiales bacterium]|nr:ATP-binding SpoIIE family protein phosphatase [Acidimicrobiales bacterium]
MTAAEDVEWVAVEDRSAPGHVRRAATALAERLGFGEARRSEVGVAATELATNLHRHAVAGTVAIRIRRAGTEAGLQLVVVDSGPGIADLGVAMVDGHSTAGTLGVGLGAVRRLASRYDAFSVVDRGTVMVATFWASTPPAEPDTVEALTRPIRGETVCGDACAWRVEGDVTVVMLADGLGHGPLAALASQRAIQAFRTMPSTEPAEILGLLNPPLAATRGAAVSVARIDAGRGTVRFAGIGNVAGWIDDGDKRRQMVCFPGIVGQNRKKTIRQLDYEVPPDGLVVLHSDGLTGKWTLDDYPTIRRRDRLVIAASLLRDAGVRHDDASVVVAGAA